MRERFRIFSAVILLLPFPVATGQTKGDLPRLRTLSGRDAEIKNARLEVELLRDQLQTETEKMRSAASQTLILREKLEASEARLTRLTESSKEEKPPLPFTISDVVIETELKPEKPVTTQKIAPIIYSPRSAVNYPERDRVLREVLVLVKRNPSVRIQLTGYADEFKFEQTNLDVSRNRATYLAAWLRNNGVPKKVITGATGVGSKGPATCLPKRRVDLIIE